MHGIFCDKILICDKNLEMKSKRVHIWKDCHCSRSLSLSSLCPYVALIQTTTIVGSCFGLWLYITWRIINFFNKETTSTNQKWHLDLVHQCSNAQNRAKPLQFRTWCICLVGFFECVCACVTNTEPETNHLQTEIWIFPFEISLVWSQRQQYTKKERKNIENQPSKKRTRYPAFQWLYFWNQTLNLCIAYEL